MSPPPLKQKVGDFLGPSAEEIENEPDYGIGSHNYRIGFRNNWNRIAGIIHGGDHWETSEEPNIEKREQKEKEMKQQKEKEQQERGGEETDHGFATSSSGDDQSDTSASEDNQGEGLWRQNRGGAHSDKHHAACGPGLQAKHDEDVQYKRLRKKYTPQEIVLLRALEHEKNYMHSLE